MEHVGDDDTALQLRHLSLSAAASVTDGEPRPRATAAAQPDPPGKVEASPAAEAAAAGTDGLCASPRRPSSSLVLARSRRPSPSPSHPAATGAGGDASASLVRLPNEVLLHILGFLDVCDLLSTSRTSHHLRELSRAPILHDLRLRHTRAILPPLLSPPRRPSLADLMARSIFLTHTAVVSRQLARSLVSVRLARRLAARPSAEALVARCVLPPECAPGIGNVAPSLVARRRAIERERLKDGLRRWVGAVWGGQVRLRGEGVRSREERSGVGRVWRLRRYWERVGRGGGGGGGGGGGVDDDMHV